MSNVTKSRNHKVCDDLTRLQCGGRDGREMQQIATEGECVDVDVSNAKNVGWNAK